MDVDDHSNITRNNLGPTDTPQPPANEFYPYPNYNSFRLGDWYWNHGLQKTHRSFRDLLDIVGDTDFHSSDVRHTRWESIDTLLASDETGDWEWLDDGACWIKSSVEISVPFHRKTPHPGPQTFTVSDFHHRDLISVIKERVKNNPHFHFELYELYWQVGDNSPPVRVYGELYSSPAFNEAHLDLQNSPPEPGCNIPRVVAALMFWSDSTNLSSFGDSQLWPLYLFMGNESKYRRCKTSRNLCSHVAYFQKVWAYILRFIPSLADPRSSFQLTSGTSLLKRQAEKSLVTPS